MEEAKEKDERQRGETETCDVFHENGVGFKDRSEIITNIFQFKSNPKMDSKKVVVCDNGTGVILSNSIHIYMCFYLFMYLLLISYYRLLHFDVYV